PASAWQNAQAERSAPAEREPDEPFPNFTPPPGMISKTTDMGGASDPHAGLDLGGASDPHAGLDMSGASNPHAGLDMNGDGEPDNPHGAIGLGASDPDRPIDPSHRVTGTITVDPKAGAKLTPGTSVFLTIRRAGPDGAPSGPPLVVDKLTWTGDGMAF